MGIFKAASPLVKALTANANLGNKLRPLATAGCSHTHGHPAAPPSIKASHSHFGSSSTPSDEDKRINNFTTTPNSEKARPWDHVPSLNSMRNFDSDRADYEKIMGNNRAWVEKRLETEPDYFKNQKLGQTPKYLWIGCSDARVPAENLTGLNDGEIFVHRNIANMVVNTDINMLSVLTYAVEVLKVKHIIVCGHYGCGGVKTATEANHDLGIIEHWLRNIRDVKRLHMTELNSIVDEEVRYRRLVELNVVEQCINLFKTGVVQNSRTESGYPLIHGLVYDIGDGLLKELNLDLIGYMKQYRSVYRLYT
ncbi:hypothetical protein SARC_03682 [Sphaeroforma arctica JP610]|uniref:Carbonic anhydrase n=1 Tax=Sphaeroforma arctica JP610 TaxID=667725 RepID=A0A0L0G5A6_9EUKA|nr:hypothetical protein SARC_03682 [Sphaeroforma arctica JP610]KNC84089.1 hypothetical protein SARC_03682 [Sphaeroforma arctica JP610]|eukprot:XP_014157991.1 hypothetical protein SARC_03682 [Sphaeroforma arctica JP610]